MKKVIFTGAGVALVTPFDADGNVNFPMLEKMLNYQVENSTDAIIICATTGEGSTLSHEEHVETVKFTVDVINGRIPVIAGTGSNDTAYAIKLSNEVEKVGVDALLMVTPYYNKTSQHGLVRHFNNIAENVDKPIILYNVPSRTGMNILPETYYELSRNEKIVGTKEANGDISAIAMTAALCGDDLAIYSGNDDQITPIMAYGGKGVISVLSNIAPKLAHDIAATALNGDIAASARLQLEYIDLCHDLFLEVNPVPAKEAMAMMGWDIGECRMPLAPMLEANKEKLRRTLAKHGMI